MRAPKKSGATATQPGGEPKDTLRNIRETKEFVISVVTHELAEAMNLTSGEYDATIDEFEAAKVASAPSRLVSVHVDERNLKEGRLDRNSLDLIGRMGGMQYTRTTERFEMVRPKVE